MANVDIAWEHLPGLVRDNLSREQWQEAQRGVVAAGARVPETTVYVNLKNGVCRQYQRGEAADGPLLATHDLSGGRGADDSQFHTTPRGAHMP